MIDSTRKHSALAVLPARTLIAVSGEDRASFLQGLVTNDVERLAPGEARFAGLLTPQGKILVDFLIYNAGEMLIVDCAQAEAAGLSKRLGFYKLRARVSLEDVSPRLRAGVWWGESAAEASAAGAAFRDPRLGALGWRVLLDAGAEDQAGASFEDYERWRIGLAVPDGGRDYAFGDTFPHEACFDLLHGVDFKKGCYVGQEVVSRMHHRGTARTRVVAVSADMPLPHGGCEIMAAGYAVGRLGSVCGPRGIGLARLDRVAEALAAGQSLEAGGIAVRLAAPSWAPYSVGVKAAGVNA